MLATGDAPSQFRRLLFQPLDFLRLLFTVRNCRDKLAQQIRID
jgi:hypothetical protein